MNIPLILILSEYGTIYNMSRLNNEIRFMLNSFGLILMVLAAPHSVWGEGVQKKRPSIQEQVKKLEDERIKQMQDKTRELFDARNLSAAEKEELKKPFPKPPSPEEEARQDAEVKKELEAMKTKLTPEEEAKVKDFFKNQARDDKKAKGQLDLKPQSGREKSEMGAPSQRTFRKGLGKSPAEYGTSTAVPGQADQEEIEFSGAPRKKEK
jgi:hypothetical protein